MDLKAIHVASQVSNLRRKEILRNRKWILEALPELKWVLRALALLRLCSRALPPHSLLTSSLGTSRKRKFSKTDCVITAFMGAYGEMRSDTTSIPWTNPCWKLPQLDLDPWSVKELQGVLVLLEIRNVHQYPLDSLAPESRQKLAQVHTLHLLISCSH